MTNDSCFTWADFGYNKHVYRNLEVKLEAMMGEGGDGGSGEGACSVGVGCYGGDVGGKGTKNGGH